MATKENNSIWKLEVNQSKNKVGSFFSKTIKIRIQLK
jgi:hypothetical protein